MKDTSMTHIIAAVENALTSGRWNDAAPLLSDLLANGIQCTLKPLADYEKLAGRVCDNAHVRQQLTSRLRMVDDAQGRFKEHAQRFEAERLAKIVREHGMPARVVRDGQYLKVACQVIHGTNRGDTIRHPGKWTWDVEEIRADYATVSEWLGYGNPKEERVA